VKKKKRRQTDEFSRTVFSAPLVKPTIDVMKQAGALYAAIASTATANTLTATAGIQLRSSRCQCTIIIRGSNGRHAAGLDFPRAIQAGESVRACRNHSVKNPHGSLERRKGKSRNRRKFM